ncbi:glutamine amidotransferase [Scopulibacillus darangshiensis]|uniref:Imidazole glycerol phosphate synthase subunit HisH n=1 Tax=Scopulibacillus darangshiensis TaxID=442528 RepID=A0A4R2NSQ4_9BACL|nr:imidazole glycerol phosphate synthase subunit HisH [Scopulibacillus darangshiensis]TCP24877.1 glutamine amidotransferase [Scopulibacillus darangshiensis]
MIGILDYGMGNLHSVCSALKRLHVPYIVSSNHDELRQSNGIILPGVGAFRDAMVCLKRDGHIAFLREYAESKPMLGICLGMQLLFDESEENGLTPGLSLLKGRVIRFTGSDVMRETYKVPHMGWNHLDFKKPESPLLQGLSEDYAYFVHSYYVMTSDESLLIATAGYHVEVPAIVGKGHVFGTQFHPEKSGPSGLAILKNFCSLAQGGVRT